MFIIRLKAHRMVGNHVGCVWYPMRRASVQLVECTLHRALVIFMHKVSGLNLHLLIGRILTLQVYRSSRMQQSNCMVLPFAASDMIQCLNSDTVYLDSLLAGMFS